MTEHTDVKKDYASWNSRKYADKLGSMNHLGRKLFHLLGGLGLLAVYFIVGRKYAFFLYGARHPCSGVGNRAAQNAVVNRFLFTLGASVRESEEQVDRHRPISWRRSSLYAYSIEVAAAAICFPPVTWRRNRRAVWKTKIAEEPRRNRCVRPLRRLSRVILTVAGLELVPWAHSRRYYRRSDRTPADPGKR
jgi:hypothetical protein